VEVIDGSLEECRRFLPSETTGTTVGTEGVRF
jgi:hypothetical protein